MKTMTTTVGTIFINDWLANFGIPSKVFADDSRKPTTTGFQVICEELVAKSLTATE